MNHSKATRALAAALLPLASGLDALAHGLAAIPAWLLQAVEAISPPRFHTSYARQRRGRAA